MVSDRYWIILILCISRLFRLTVSLNITNLLNQYVLVCGFDYICNSSLVSLVNSSSPVIPTGYHNGSPCPRCKCDDKCFISNDCCPDILFTHSDVTCEDMAIVGERYGVLTVASCPDSFPDTEIKNRCTKNYTSSEVFVNVPVYSRTKGITYRNKKCAECNGDVDTKPWNINIQCNAKVDLNHFSSYEDLFDAAKQHRCQIQYNQLGVRTHYICDSANLVSDKASVSQCNITGQWKTYDPDIEWACNNLNNIYRSIAKYKVYKNIFCYMCNTGKHSTATSLIESCNVTGHWYPHDDVLLQACLSYQWSDVSYPFKNVFCFLCNRNTNITSTFLDISTSDEEQLMWNSETKRFVWKALFHVKNFVFDPRLVNEMRFNTSSKQRLTVDFAALLSSKINRDGNKVDVTKLVEYHYLHFGFQNFCKDWVINGNYTTRYREDTRHCRCDLGCFGTRDCCFDLALLFPLKKEPLAIASCVTDIEVDPFIKSSCENKNSSAELLYHLPVISKSTYIVYANMFCYICNEKTFETLQGISLHDLYLIPQNIEVKCSFMFDTTWYSTLQDMVSDGEKFSCTTKFLKDNTDVNYISHYTVSRCNETGLWSAYDPDIEWACEHFFSELTQLKLNGKKVFKNLFCKICNEANEESNAKHITTCSSLKQVGEDLVYACENLPRINTMGIYKNWFCKQCNRQKEYVVTTGCYPPSIAPPDASTDQVNDSRSTIYIKREKHKLIQNTYRIMFSIAIPDSDNPATNTAQRCNNVEIYDSVKKLCRKVICYDGSILRNGRCTPLLETATNLGYTIAVRLDGNLTNMQDVPVTVANFTDSLPRILLSILREQIGNYEIDMAASFTIVNESCSLELQPKTQNKVSLLVHFSFNIIEFVHRPTVEKILLNLTQDTVIYLETDFSMNVTCTVDYYAMVLPVQIYSMDYNNIGCFKMQQSSVYDTVYRLSLVSKMLTCKQVELEPDQYTFDPFRLRITLTPTKKILDIGNFRLLSQNGVAICEDDFREMMNKATNIRDYDVLALVLGVVSITCVCFSLLGLFLTFVTYCMFSKLRTIPGKNNMCLIVALFIAQSLVQFGLMQTEYPVLCVVLGISMHYFWLATFFCMNVCSFHMFYTFVFPFSKMQSSRATLRYILYSYGTSALIVLIHIAVSLSATGTVGYGKYKCFVSSVPALVASFIAPVFLICFIDVFLFSFAAYKLKSSPKVTSNKNSKVEFQVYVKLFVLTGITWILQLVESFLPISYFSIVVSALNGSQGIFIFLSYCVCVRVRALYSERFLVPRSSSNTRTERLTSNSSSGSCLNSRNRKS